MRELREISLKLNALDLLTGVHLAAYNLKQLEKQLKTRGQAAAAYLLLLDMEIPQKRHMTITTYAPQDLSMANEDYINLEKQIFGNPKKQAVLLSVSKVADLRPAYPNYYGDAHIFVWTIKDFIHS